jgi:hypothetical protein
MIIFAACSLVLIPISFALAQGNLPSQIVPCNGPDCNLCHLVELAQRIINIGIFITIALSAMTFAYAGFLHLTAGGDIGKAKSARQIFTKVAVGLMIILGAWIGVDTLMKTVVDESKLGPWNSIGCGQNISF